MRMSCRSGRARCASRALFCTRDSLGKRRQTLDWLGEGGGDESAVDADGGRGSKTAAVGPRRRPWVRAGGRGSKTAVVGPSRRPWVQDGGRGSELMRSHRSAFAGILRSDLRGAHSYVLTASRLRREGKDRVVVLALDSLAVGSRDELYEDLAGWHRIGGMPWRRSPRTCRRRKDRGTAAVADDRIVVRRHARK